MGGVRRLIETLLHRLPQGPEDPTVAPAPPPGAAAAAVAGIPPPGAAGTASDVAPYHRILPSPLVWQASSPGASQHPSRDVRTGHHLKHSADSNPSAAIPMAFGAGRSIEAKNTATADATDCPLPGPDPKLVSALQVLLPASAPHRGFQLCKFKILPAPSAADVASFSTATWESPSPLHLERCTRLPALSRALPASTLTSHLHVPSAFPP